MEKREFDLNIEKVLEDWTVSLAIREIIANAIDEQILTKSKDIEINKDQQGNWHVRDYGRGIKYTHFTQNENEEKLSHPYLIGKFGVGLKDALATFDRHQIAVEIISRYGKITMGRSCKYGFSDIITLHAYIETASDNDFIGTDFVIKGCTNSDIDIAKQMFLRYQGLEALEKTSLGEIYRTNNNIASIYLNGVKIANEDNFLFSYNITSLNSSIKKALNRERINVGRSAYTERVKSILLQAKSETVIDEITKNLNCLSQGTMKDELKWTDVATHAVRILSSRDNVVFVTPREIEHLSGDTSDIVNRTDKKIVFVTENVREKIEDLRDNQGENIETVSTVLDDYRDSFKYKFVLYDELSKEEKYIFDFRNKIASFCEAEYLIDSICISESIKPDIWGFSCSGCWDSYLNKIVIKRNQLNSLEEFSGTLIHEIIHAHKKLHDVTREFESELTIYIGKLANITFENGISKQLERTDNKSLYDTISIKINEVSKQLSGYASLYALFPPSFISKYSKYKDIQEFLDNLPFPVRNQADYDSKNESLLNHFVASHTPFQAWRDMINKAVPIYVSKKKSWINSGKYYEPKRNPNLTGANNIFEYINIKPIF